MSLSSLPLEIFSNIIDHVVVGLGIEGSAHLRLVSRTFDVEIRCSYARTSQFKSDRRFSMASHSPSKCAFFAKYLLLRPYGKGKAENADVSYYLNDIVDQLLSKETVGNQDETPYQLLYTLCRKLRPVHLSIYPSPIKPASNDTDAMNLLTAAIYTNRLSLLDEMLNTHKVNFETDSSALFETPLLAAVETQNPDTVRKLLAHNAPFKPPSPSTKRTFHPGPLHPGPLLIAVKTKDLPILKMLLDPSSGLCKSDLSYQDALVSSITSSDSPHHPIFDLLLSHFSEPLSSAPYILAEGLRAACRAGNTDLIAHLLDSGADINSTMNHRATHAMAAPIAQAAWLGQIPALNLLLSRGAALHPVLDANAGVRTQHPGADALRAATWGNHWPAAKILLDAGVADHLSQSDWCSVLKIAALHADCVVVAAGLLDSGVIRLAELAEDKMASEDTVVELVAIVCQRGNERFMRTLVRHGLPVTGHPMYKRSAYPVPIVQAMAWDQQGVVRVLQELAGQQMDEEMMKLAEVYREKEVSRLWAFVTAPGCGMPRYTILK